MNNQINGGYYIDSSTEKLEDYSYTRGIGAYKPHFAGVPANYYPLTCKEICFGILILIFVIAFNLGVLIGFIFWVQAGGLEGYVIAWVAVGLTFVVLMLILFYRGGKQKRRMEKELIA